MKILVISDLHSNIYALNTILGFEKDLDMLCCAGDLLDYGTTPVEVIERLSSLEIPTHIVCGNHDLDVIETWHKGTHQHVCGQDFKWIHHNCNLIQARHVDFLMRLPEVEFFEADGFEYLLKHQYKESYETIDNVQKFEEFWHAYMPGIKTNKKNKRIIFGHTHQQCIHILKDNRVWLNPGSTSYRRPGDMDKTAQYLIIDCGMIELKSIPYNREALFAEALVYKTNDAMMHSEIADFEFFFG